MPLIKRMVEPVELSRAHIGQGIRNELECVTNNTLANVIRQLSSLSKHAEDMFDELTKEATHVFHRANNLQDRIDKLRIKVTQLDSTVAVVSLQEINMRKPFKSSVIREQQIISKESRPRAIQESYEKCDAPPALNKLNTYREDGKDSMKFYTDSTYFFELWRAEMEKDTENQRQIVKQKVQKKRRPDQRAPQPIKQVQQRRYDDMAMGKEFQQEPSRRPVHNIAKSHVEGGKSDRPNSLEIPKDGEYITPSHNQGAPKHEQHNPAQHQNHVMSNGPVHNTDSYDRTSAYTQPPMNYSDGEAKYRDGSPDKHLRGSVTSISSPGRPAHRPPPPPGPGSPDMGSRSSSRNTLPPPPPPPPLPDNIHTSPIHSHENTPSPLLDGSSTPGSAILPPPPPPLPPFPDDTPGSITSMPPPPPSPPMDSGGMGGMAPPPPPPPPPMDVTPPSQPSPVPKQKNPAVALPEPQAGRSDLLEAIRRGIQLRQVQQKEDQTRRKSTSKLDVQSIMEAAFEMRRRAMEENDSEEEDDDEPEDWD